MLRLRAGGDRRQRRITIGSAAVLSLAEARARARKLVDLAREGIDPLAGKAEQRAQARNTVAAIAEEYAQRHLRRNLKSGHWTERRLKTDVVAVWGDRQIRSITKADVIRLVDGIADRGAGVMANRTLQLAGRFFAWAVGRSLIEVNPCAGVDLPHKERERSRVLTEAEVRAVWAAFEVMLWPFGTIGQLLLLLGQRRSEVAGMAWAEIDVERALWELPASRSKSDTAHTVPLPPLAVSIIETVPRIVGTDLLFPSRRPGAGPVSGFSGALARAHDLSATSTWVWHDLRRTCRTGFARLGVTAAVGERILNHSDGTASRIAKIYDRHSYEAEMRRALELWAAEVERIVGGVAPKIVALPRR